ncbi:hypothetical protein, partial [Comamonas aquatica]|uniref:hypothetical protein n=1 Tax=Comamonas aquatica TaxID=225991 RepID=UPI003D06ABF8
MPLSALPPSPTASFSTLKRRCIGWANSGQPVHMALMAIVLLVLAASWWLTAKHLRAQLAQAEQAARLQQSGLAAIVSENL